MNKEKTYLSINGNTIAIEDIHRITPVIGIVTENRISIKFDIVCMDDAIIEIFSRFSIKFDRIEDAEDSFMFELFESRKGFIETVEIFEEKELYEELKDAIHDKMEVLHRQLSDHLAKHKEILDLNITIYEEVEDLLVSFRTSKEETSTTVESLM